MDSGKRVMEFEKYLQIAKDYHGWRSDLFCLIFLEHKKNRWKFQEDRLIELLLHNL